MYQLVISCMTLLWVLSLSEPTLCPVSILSLIWSNVNTCTVYEWICGVLGSLTVCIALCL